MPGFARTIEELEQKAVKWWPPELSEKAASASIIPSLLKTQESFISILNLSKESPTQFFEIIRASNFPANLFLKHLAVLADFGGEQIKQLNSDFNHVFAISDSDYGNVFPMSERSMYFEFLWRGNKYKYIFKKLPLPTTLNNKKLEIDGRGLLNTRSAMDDLKQDVAMILMFGSNALNPSTSELLQKCEIGNLLGSVEELEKYVRQKYIWVSRITGGEQCNTLGQLAQNYVAEFLTNALPSGYRVTRSGQIEGVKHTDDGALTKFDIVVHKGDKAVAIEVSFQVTTNSTIERKSRNAKARYDLIRESGNYIAYIIDGAGNFVRRSAISDICQYSDCTVALSEKEFLVLADFIKSVLK